MSLRTEFDRMNNYIPNWCFNDEKNKFCKGQLCSDCPKKSVRGVETKR